MALFKLAKGKAQAITPKLAAAKERDVQDVVEGNLEEIFAVRFVAREFPTGSKHRGRIDTLGLDQDGSPVIVEYKRTSHSNIINQGLFYLDWLMDHRGDFELAAQKALGPKLEVSWSQPRLILLAHSFNRYDQYAVNRIDDRIELWTYMFYEGDFLRVERLDTEERAEGDKKSSKTKTPKSSPDYSLAHHTAKMSQESLELFETVRERILALGDDVDERFMNQYVGYRRLRNFAEIVGQKKGLKLFIDGDVADPDGIGKDVSQIGHWGTGNLEVKVEESSDIDRVMALIKQAYELQA